MSGGGLGASEPSSPASARRRVVDAARGGDVHDGLREPGRERGTDRRGHDRARQRPSRESRGSTNATPTARGREGLAHLPSLRSTASACWELTAPSVARALSPRRTTPTPGVRVMTRRTTGAPAARSRRRSPAPADRRRRCLACPARSQSSAPRPSSAASDSAPGQHPDTADRFCPSAQVAVGGQPRFGRKLTCRASSGAPRSGRTQRSRHNRAGSVAVLRCARSAFRTISACDVDLALVSASSGGSDDAAEAEV